MDEDEAALLAELRAISQKSAASRFEVETVNDAQIAVGANGKTPIPQKEQATVDGNTKPNVPAGTKIRKDSPLMMNKTEVPQLDGQSPVKPRVSTPPWKRKRKASIQQPEGDVVVDAPLLLNDDENNPIEEKIQVVEKSPKLSLPWKRNPPKQAEDKPSFANADSLTLTEQKHPQSQYGIKSDFKSTFQGDRGGAAEDAELLALLRGVSAKSSAGRFGDEDDIITNSVITSKETDESISHKKVALPWKRNLGKRNTFSHQDKADETSPDPSSAETASGEAKSQHGGPDEYTKSLTLIQGQAGSSESTENRIDSDKANTEPTSATTPPWKRRSRVPRKQPNVSNIADPQTSPENNAILNSINRESGGVTEDAEHLVLLRDDASKSTRSRFDDKSEHPSEKIPADTAALDKEEAENFNLSPGVEIILQNTNFNVIDASNNENSLQVSICDTDTHILSSSPKAKAQSVPSFGIKSDLPSTFSGERGGVAEDEELLALLRKVSSGAASTRFSENHVEPASISNSAPKDAPKKQACKTSTSDLTLPVSLIQNPIADAESHVTRESLCLSLSDKNWKIRAQAYDMLASILKDAVHSASDTMVDSNYVLEDLDEMLPSFVEDTNAGALDRALDFAILYAEHCRNAGDAEQARKIASSLIRKNAFSARPATSKLASSLALKLMEVGTDGVLSLHSVVNVLLSEGITSKKPKVIQASVSLILDATVHFGAASLPLAIIVESASKMASHTNAIVRETTVRILAEIVRVMKSKAPIQSVIDNMKKAQVSDLDMLLASQPEPTPAQTGLRSLSRASCKDDFVALTTDAKDLELQRFSNRPYVNVVEAVAKSEYADQLALSKWSNKVAALDIVIACGGEKPYKLAQPSESIDYNPLISDMRKLLSHTHFAVSSKAMEVISMLAEGVREKLYPHLRPVLASMLEISKDKKLTRAISSCLDSCFGNVLSFDQILDTDGAFIASVDERKQKNSLSRSIVLEFLGRCVERNESAGPKGGLSVLNASQITALCSQKLSDSDASTRKAALKILQSLQNFDDENIVKVVCKAVSDLKTSNPRAYKALAITETAAACSSDEGMCERSANTTKTLGRTRAGAPSKKTPTVTATISNTITTTTCTSLSTKTDMPSDESSIPHLEEALVHVSSLRIPLWDAPADDSGILEGLKASKWLLRQDAIKSLVAFVESGGLCDSSHFGKDISSILVVVREQTRAFNETNVNIMKAIIQLFIALCKFSESKECCLSTWVVSDSVTFCIQKISDRKLSDSCKTLLTSICVVSMPSSVIVASFEKLSSHKSLVVHEEFLKWLQTFLNDFGAVSMGSELSEITASLIGEMSHASVKVQKEAASCLALIHRQIGPGLKALALSLAKSDELKNRLQRCIENNPFDPSLSTRSWPKQSISFQNSLMCTSAQDVQRLALILPKTDLFSLLSENIVDKLGSKEGKTSWKLRKEALEEVEAAVEACCGSIDTNSSRLKQLVELTRSIRDRISDTQINLRPMAARLIGAMLSSVDQNTQAKLGKIVFAPLINAAINDMKKILRDESLNAISAGVTISGIQGNGLNELAAENFVSAFVAEVNEAAIRAGGLPDVLHLLLTFVNQLPNLDCVVSARGLPLGEKFAEVLVECLTSSKSETRSAAQSVLELSFANQVVALGSIRKAQGLLKPALQRSVEPMIAKMSQCEALASSKPNETTQMSKSGAKTEHTKNALKRSRIDPGLKPLPSPSLSNATGISSYGGKKHPLLPRSGKNIPNPSKCILWPVYPEEPHGSILDNLKRVWVLQLPPTSVAALFPTAGIKKQDDAKDGCELISRAILFDRSEGTSGVEDQLDLILKWIMYALCSMESTTGQMDILSTAKDLFMYMKGRRREFNDSEALESIPFILEKASNAKGRFRDVYLEITALIESEDLLPTKRLGSVVCVAMMDASTHAKSRASACEMCIACVDKVGLGGLGKKGVLAAAKVLSQETSKYRVSALDLLQVILSKMNGDMQRLVRICGSALTDKAKQQIEERLSQDSHMRASPGASRIPSHQILLDASPNKLNMVSGSPSSDLYEQLPKLTLRSETNKSRPLAKVVSRDFSGESLIAPLGSFRETLLPDTGKCDEVSDLRLQPIQSVDESTYSMTELSGTAAALRARLLKIREKSAAVEDCPVVIAQSWSTSSKSHIFEAHLESIKSVLAGGSPIADNDTQLVVCIASLKVFHAVLSRQNHSAVEMSDAEFESVRNSIVNDVDRTIELFRSLIAFALKSGLESVNAGILLPLLSLCLAALMALFRDNEYASGISVEELAILLREIGVALLDQRLSSGQLNEETGSQMIRAINKLAVQAATGASRSVSFQALMTLQLQLNFNDDSNAHSESSLLFSHRLSRIVSKLFSRVVRAEEANAKPYSEEHLNMETIIRALDDYLSTCEKAMKNGAFSIESVEICIDMAKVLVISILDAHASTMSIRHFMQQLGINVVTSALGNMVSVCEDEVGIKRAASSTREKLTSEGLPKIIQTNVSSKLLSFPPRLQTKSPSKDVATMVSQLANSSVGEEREEALEAIRHYKTINGEEEINAHLQQLSGPFREYIEEQLHCDPSPQKISTSLELADTSASVSDRIRNLRSRLKVTEMAVHNSVEQKAPLDVTMINKSDDVTALRSPMRLAASTKESRLAAPTPSRLQSPPLQSKLAQAVPARTSASLRERLTGPKSEGLIADSTSRASALRARLEAVKVQSQKQRENS